MTQHPTPTGGLDPTVTPSASSSPALAAAAGTPLQRRTFLRGSATLAATGLAASACGGAIGSGAGGGKVPFHFWNLFGGGDGARMIGMINDFKKQHPKIAMESVTLSWGPPYYTKLAMAAAGGRAPDTAILHLSRMPGYAPGRLLDPFDLKLLAEFGVEEKNFPPGLWKRAQANGKVYAIPLDTHPFVLFYNTKICKQAGLLGSDGLLKPIKSGDQFLAALTKTQQVTKSYGLAYSAADVSTVWRLFWSLYRQKNGTVELPPKGKTKLDEGKATEVLRYMQKLTDGKLGPRNVDYPGAIALFSSGKAGFHLNGEWEITTFQTAKLPFSITTLPQIFENANGQGDSHSFVLPHQRNRDPEKTRASYEFIAWMLKNSVDWAKGGHIPAYLPAAESAAFKALKPQAYYAPAAERVQLDPPAWFTGSASDFDNNAGAAFGIVLSQRADPAVGIRQFKTAVNKLLQVDPPV